MSIEQRLLDGADDKGNGVVEEAAALIVSLRQDVAELQAKVEQLNKIAAENFAAAVAAQEERDQLKSWEASIRAEVGELYREAGMMKEIESLALSDQWTIKARGENALQIIAHYKHSAEHLATKLVEARAVVTKVTSRLLETRTVLDGAVSAMTLNNFKPRDEDYHKYEAALKHVQSQPLPLAGEQS